MGSFVKASRFTPSKTWAVGFAATSLLAFLGALGLFLTDVYHLPWTGPTRFTLMGFIGPLAASLSVVVLLRVGGRLPAGVS